MRGRKRLGLIRDKRDRERTNADAVAARKFRLHPRRLPLRLNPKLRFRRKPSLRDSRDR